MNFEFAESHHLNHRVSDTAIANCDFSRSDMAGSYFSAKAKETGEFPLSLIIAYSLLEFKSENPSAKKLGESAYQKPRFAACICAVGRRCAVPSVGKSPARAPRL